MHLPPHPRAAGPLLQARPEDRCRRGSLDAVGLPELPDCWRSEAFAEDLPDAPVEPAAAVPAFLPRALRPRAGPSLAPWFRWNWRGSPLQAGR